MLEITMNEVFLIFKDSLLAHSHESRLVSCLFQIFERYCEFLCDKYKVASSANWTDFTRLQVVLIQFSYITKK